MTTTRSCWPSTNWRLRSAASSTRWRSPMTDEPTVFDQPGGADDEHPPVHPETVAIRAGRADNGRALAPILWSSTTFVTPTVDEGRRLATSVGPTHFYGRYGNPTVSAFEDAIAQLEG